MLLSLNPQIIPLVCVEHTFGKHNTKSRFDQRYLVCSSAFGNWLL